MSNSAAAIVKSFMDKYIFINLLKTKKNRYGDQALARFTLSMACHIAEEMDFLVRSNNANDFLAIKDCMKKYVALIHSELRHRQTLLDFFTKTKLPPDFGRCVNEAWYRLHDFEKEERKREEFRISYLRGNSANHSQQNRNPS